jgi:ATP-dependent helicase Lhr and Lhr-like helicase
LVSDRADRLALKKRLGRTWGAFFERHGNFTPVQIAAIPTLLDGHNAVICAPTASGKTEAAIVPLIECHCQPHSAELTILYITPTRALVNDLLGRLQIPLDTLRIALASKTRDLNTFDPRRPARILITTPESVDSLLAAHAPVFANLRAVIIDELHLFDGTPRGDQLRVIIRRLHQIRAYAAVQGAAPDDSLQIVALSATLADPPRTAARYFDNAQVIQGNTRRTLDMELLPLAEESAAELLAFLRDFRSRGWRKALVFCNSRAEVEGYAAALQGQSPFGDAVYTHYSNIAPQRRIEIEQQFALSDVALCFATSTLELGIDIGSIDVVILIGPSGDVNSFGQQIGRGNRRSAVLRVACFYRTPLERLMFEALQAAWTAGIATDAPGEFRPSVVVQQIFSLIKQSPTGSVRLKMLMNLLDRLVTAADVRAIVGHLQRLDYLKEGRPGEWRPGERLSQLYDQQASTYSDLSIYSNIRGQTARPVEVRDRYTHQTVASVDAEWLSRPVLTLEGRSLHVEWSDGEAMWVSAAYQEHNPAAFYYRGARKYLSFHLAQLLPARLGLSPQPAVWIATDDGWCWFHWLGDLYGQVLFGLLRPYVVVERGKLPGLCLLLHDDPATLSWPGWPAAQVRRHIEAQYQSLERILDLGPFQHLLPAALRRRIVVDQFDMSLFISATSSLRLSPAPETVSAALTTLIS